MRSSAYQGKRPMRAVWSLLRLLGHLAAKPVARLLTQRLAAWLRAVLGPVRRLRERTSGVERARRRWGAPRTAAATVAPYLDQMAPLSGAC